MIPSTKNDQVKIKNAVDEVVNSMTRIAAERDNIKEICDNIKEEYEIKPKVVRNAAKMVYNRDKPDVDAEYTEITEIYEIATK